ncbi:MAG: prepilin-type N-terminal cleavage/methylation domain-containing protein [Phycisphaerae bacterium]|nr:prepilin-type N-terminal cleavage/methylation domain-containing protein [Phycisphaerae bacterium]
MTRTGARRPPHGGFTLIELLVVVSIIALLLSILLPSLQKAREQAKEVKCASQLAGFGRGFYAYAAGNDDYLCSGSFDPDVANGRDGPVDKVGWVADLVNGRYAEPGEALCPSNAARVNQKIAEGPSGCVPSIYCWTQVDDLIDRGYNTNYTQAWYMARSQAFWPNPDNDPNWRRLRSTWGPLNITRMTRVSPSRVPILGDGGIEDADVYRGDKGLGELVVKTLSDGPCGGAYGPQDYSDFGPAHGMAARFRTAGAGRKSSVRTRADVLFADGHVGRFQEKVRNGEFKLLRADTSGNVWVQEDLSEEVFDGVLTLGRRSRQPWQLQ